MVEFYRMCQSDNGSINDQSALRQWSVNYMRSLETLKDPRAPMQLQNMLTAAGMRNAECRMIPVPLCGWPNSEYSRVVLLKAALSLRLLAFSELSCRPPC